MYKSIDYICCQLPKQPLRTRHFGNAGPTKHIPQKDLAVVNYTMQQMLCAPIGWQKPFLLPPNSNLSTRSASYWLETLDLLYDLARLFARAERTRHVASPSWTRSLNIRARGTRGSHRFF